MQGSVEREKAATRRGAMGCALTAQGYLKVRRGPADGESPWEPPRV